MLPGMVRCRGLALIAAHLAAALLAQAGCALAQAPCTGLNALQQAEYQAWQHAPRREIASGAGGEPLPLVAIGTRAQVKFHRGRDVAFKLEAPPQPARKNGYAGRLALEPRQDGEYRIMIATPAWVDIVDPATGAALDPSPVERELRCAGIAKNIGYVLKGKKRYWLQIQDSAHAETAVLVVLQPK